MANIIPVVSKAVQGANSIVTAVWSNMTAGDLGVPVALTDWHDRSIQFVGTFGGNMTIQGSNESAPVNWSTLRDPGSITLVVNAADIKQTLEMALWLRPIAGAGIVLVTVTMAGRQLIPLAWS